VRAALLGQVLQAAEIILTESSIFSPEYMLVLQQVLLLLLLTIMTMMALMMRI
jgi:hypothetical protein